MICNNIISFENLIPIPSGIDYSIPSGQIKFSVAVNTDNLEITTKEGEYPIENSDLICPNKLVKGNVDLYQIRVSGYLNYSISVKCLQSSENFNVEVPFTDVNGWVSQSSTLPLFSEEALGIKTPYLITGYNATGSTSYNIIVTLTTLIVEEPVVINDNKVILVKGSFTITTQ